MHLNTELLNQIKNSWSSILAVTKYLNKEQTEEVLQTLQREYWEIFFWIGENRVESMMEKNMDRELVHFIWNIQSKELKYIIDHALTIHSLDDIKHAKKINELCELKDTWVRVFVQINVDSTKDGGIQPEALPWFLAELDEMENIGVMWISAIGKSDCTREEKIAEFDLLLELKKKHLQNGLISAGTSLDYEIALEMWIDILRIGTKLYQ